MQYNPVAGWQNQTLQYVGNSALYLNEEQAGAPAVVVTLECVFYPVNKIYLNKEWHPDKGMWGRLTFAHRGFMVGDRLLHYPRTQLLRHFDLVTKMRLALQAEHVAILNYLDESGLDLTEPSSWMDFIQDLVFGPVGNNLYGTSDQTVGAHPTEFRLATHPEAEWEWNVWWQEWDDVVMNLDPPLPPSGEPGPDEPSPPDEPPAVPDETPNDPAPPDYFEDDFGPQAEPLPPAVCFTQFSFYYEDFVKPQYTRTVIRDLPSPYLGGAWSTEVITGEDDGMDLYLTYNEGAEPVKIFDGGVDVSYSAFEFVTPCDDPVPD